MRKLLSWLTLAALGACAAGTGDAAGTSEPPTRPAPTTVAVVGSTSDTTTIPATSPTTTTAPSTTTTTSTATTTLPAAPIPPVRTIGSGGDSLMLGVLPPLQTALEVSGYTFTAKRFIGFIDPEVEQRWALLTTEAPDVLILFFAPWELAGLLTLGSVDLADPNWPAAYLRDFVEPRLAEFRGTGTEVIWIGLPASGDPVETLQYQLLNSFWQAAAANEPWITWLDGARLLAGPEGGYVEFDESVSPPIRLFQADGRHLCPEGGRRLADGVLTLLQARFGVVVDPAWTESGWEYNPFAYGVGHCPDNE